MNKKKILIADDLHPSFKQGAEDLGFIVDDFAHLNKDEILAIIENYDGIAIRTKFNLDKTFLEKAPHLKFIARAGAGLDNIDVDFATQQNIHLINASEGNSDAVGEHAMGLLLSLMNNLRKADIEVRNQIWDREGNRGYELKGKTVGIIGYGHMGKSFAKKIKNFGVQIIAYDKYKTNYSDEYVTESSMEQIVKYSDILSLHIPLTRETKYLVNEEYLYHFKKPIFFINTARGEIVDTQAILQALKNGKILGAGLDVLETEKFPTLSKQSWYHELINQPNVLLSPHIAGWTFESYRKISEVLVEKLKNLQL